MKIFNRVWKQTRLKLWNRVLTHAGWRVEDQVSNWVETPVLNQVGHQVGDQTGHQVRDQVWYQISTQVEDHVYKKLRNQKLGPWSSPGLGL